jgi:hypothetical protein
MVWLAGELVSNLPRARPPTTVNAPKTQGIGNMLKITVTIAVEEDQYDNLDAAEIRKMIEDDKDEQFLAQLIDEQSWSARVRAE